MFEYRQMNALVTWLLRESDASPPYLGIKLAPRADLCGCRPGKLFSVVRVAAAIP